MKKHLLAHDQPENESEKEPSAFRQVHVDYPSYQSVQFFALITIFFNYKKKGLLVHYFSFHFLFKQEQIRDSNFNTFWNKIPQMDSNWEETRNRCPSNCSSEDSRSLDVTGSEDEGEGIREGKDG